MTSPVTVSLSDLQEGKVQMTDLERAFGPQSLGILVVTGLPPQFADLRREVLRSSSKLAALPESTLGKSCEIRFANAEDGLEKPDAKYLTGWSLGKESLKPGVPDTLKGSYYINCAFHVDKSLQGASKTAPDGRIYDSFPEYTLNNVWPVEQDLPAFKVAAEQLCSLIIDTAALVARACDAFALKNIKGFEPGYLERMVKTSTTTKARLLHYFPPPAAPQSQDQACKTLGDDDWCATHLDHGCLTGLTSAMYVDEGVGLDNELDAPPDAKTGLYIHSRAGNVVKVAIPRDALAFQTGEALERITEGKFRAVPHYVQGITATGETASKIARNTLAVFTQPNLWELVDRKAGIDYAGFARGVVDQHY